MCNQMKLLMPMTVWSSDTSLPFVKWEVLSSTQRKPSCIVKKGWSCLWTKKHYKRCKCLYNKFSSSRPQELKVAYVLAYWKNMNCEVAYVFAYWKTWTVKLHMWLHIEKTWTAKLHVFVKEKTVLLVCYCYRKLYREKLESTEFWLPSLSTFQQVCTLLDRDNCLSKVTKNIFTGDEANIIVYNLIIQTV